MSEIPTYAHDLFAPEALRAPFGHYRALRDLGPVARLADPDIYVLARFAEVRDALRAPDVLASGDGVRFNPIVNTPGMPNIIQSDGALHDRLKAEVMRPLRPGNLKQHRNGMKAMVSARIRELVDVGPFEAIEKIAQLLPTQVISELVGLPEEGRAAMLDWAAATFNAIGPVRPGFENDFGLLKQARAYQLSLDRDKVRDGSWASTLFDAIEAGRLTEAEERGALSAYMLPSLDTTILAKGHLLHNLARNPNQWRKLKENPALIPGAVLEGVRHSSVIRWFSRVARADYLVGGPVGGHTIPAGARVMVIYAAANRDERQFADPDRFDITRNARSHLSWGQGAHMCAGMHLAQLEMEVMLEALVEHCGTLEASARGAREPRSLRVCAATVRVAVGRCWRQAGTKSR